LDKLPEDFLEFNVVNGEVGMLDGEYMYRLDKPVTTLTVDVENKEIIILNDSQETEDEINNNRE
jgi:hypothetical protein